MKISDIVLAFRFQNAERLFERFSHYNLQYCDCFVALDDRSGSDSLFENIRRHPKCASAVRKESSSLFAEVCDQEVMHALARATGRRFMMYLDLDEVLNPSFLQEVDSIPDVYDVYSSPYLTLYPDEFNYITAGIYGNRRRYIMSRTCDGHFDLSDIGMLHGPHFPLERNRSASKFYITSPLYHLSLSSPEVVEKRLAFYRERDPECRYQKVGYSHFQAEHPYAPLEFRFEV